MNEYKSDELFFFCDFTGNDGKSISRCESWSPSAVQAIRNCPSALHFASAELKGDKAFNGAMSNVDKKEKNVDFYYLMNYVHINSRDVSTG